MMPKHAAPVEVAPRPQPPEVAAGTTGAAIVYMADKVAWLESQPPGSIGEDEAGRKHEQLLAGLDRFRGQIAALPENKKWELAPYVHSLMPQDVTAEVGAPADISVIDELIGADNEQLIAFARRHVATLTMHEKDMQPFMQEQCELFEMGIRYAVAEGKVSPYALKVIDTLATAKIRIGDWWATRIQQDRHGYYDLTTDVMTIAQGLGRTSDERNDDFRRTGSATIPHELFHREFEFSIPKKDGWLHEAMAEHLGLSLIEGEMDKLSPYDRTGTHGVYTDYRLLAAEMMDGLDTPELLTRAVTSKAVNSNEWLALDKALLYKYGIEDVPGAITRRIAEHAARLEARYPDEDADAQAFKAARIVTRELATQPWLVTGLPSPQERRLGASAMTSVQQ